MIYMIYDVYDIYIYIYIVYQHNIIAKKLYNNLIKPL